MAVINMILEKPAAKAGGDKYTGTVEQESVSLYIPQAISRKSGKPALTITVTIEVAA